jgi:betaine-aldehyde dehydrogenase
LAVPSRDPTATPQQLLIGGEWVDPEGDLWLDTENPATGTTITRFPVASASDVLNAVGAADRAASQWAGTPVSERCELVIAVARNLREVAGQLAELDSLDAGLPISTASADAARAIERLEYFAGLGQELKGSTYPTSKSLAYSIRQPYGVVAIVNPFNHPLLFAITKAAAPLVAGNTLVIKPPEQAPLSTLALGHVLRDALPPGVVNIVPGDRTTGAALVSDPRIGKISFTGSVATGRKIMASAAENITPCLLELGGKNAVIVFPDAPLDEAVDGTVVGMALSVCGQSCQSGTRLYVHKSVREEFLERLFARLREIRIGDPIDDSTQMGPLISAARLTEVTGAIRFAQEEGGSLLFGGGSPSVTDHLEGGHFVEPTVIGGVGPTMRIAEDEVFGPVLAVFEWSEPAAMIDAVNRSAMGLTASIWTTSLGAHATAEAVEAGYVWINGHGRTASGLPFGGWKQSGIGTEHSIDELFEFSRLKAVDVASAGR